MLQIAGTDNTPAEGIDIMLNTSSQEYERYKSVAAQWQATIKISGNRY